jgi:hypothetical protein
MQLRYANGGATAKTVYFYVGHMSFDSGGRFSMTVSLDALASNGSCSMATPLTDGVAVNGDTTLGSTGAIPCINPATGVLYYSITVSAGKTLGVEARPTGQWDAHVAILDSCGAGACLAFSDFGPTPTATFTNGSGSPRSVIVAVASGFSGGSFSVTAALRSPPANVSCAAAASVANGTSLTCQDASAGADNLSSRCNPSDSGGVLYYSATIGAGQQLAATATATTGNWLPAIRLLSSCGATTCLASSSPMMSMVKGMTSLAYLNSGNSPIDVILAVGPSGMSPGSGYFQLDVSILTPYKMTTIATACDDMTSATPVPAISGPFTTSMPAPLPFSAPYFGDTITQFSVNSLGMLQFFTQAGGSPVPPVPPTPIPSPGPPNGMVAAYWDALAPVDPNAHVSILTPGQTPDRHFTVEWKNFMKLMDQTSRLTFQVKLFETTGVIEIHYCSLTNASGDTASIGIENMTGTLGVQAGYLKAGTATTANAYRFTPPP